MAYTQIHTLDIMQVYKITLQTAGSSNSSRLTMTVRLWKLPRASASTAICDASSLVGLMTRAEIFPGVLADICRTETMSCALCRYEATDCRYDYTYDCFEPAQHTSCTAQTIAVQKKVQCI